MSNRFWLIQRGSFNNLQTATQFLGGSATHLINPDYMGSAEFEFGAIPKAYRRILSQYDKYSMHVTDLRSIRGVPLCLYCKEANYQRIIEAIKEYLDHRYKLKEWTNMEVHFKEEEQKYSASKHKLKTNFWWCIDVSRGDNDVGDWIAFLGAADRIKAFGRIIKDDYENWWMKKPEEERDEEVKRAFKM